MNCRVRYADDTRDHGVGTTPGAMKDLNEEQGPYIGRRNIDFNKLELELE